MSSSNKESSQKPWECPGNPQCENWQTKMCKHLVRLLDPMDRGWVKLTDKESDLGDGEQEDPINEVRSRKQALKRLRKIKDLNEVEKHILIRRRFDEETFKDIGAQVGINASSAHKQYKRAIEKIKKAVENE